MKKYKYILGIATLSLMTTSCVEEVLPTDTISSEQVKGMNTVQENMLYGISAYMTTYNSWGSSSDYLNDWGYPCQMYFRELCGPDFPVSKSTYDYWTYYENCSYTSSYPYYTWNYYYRLIRNANNLIAAIDTTTASVESKRYLGSALSFRALAYLDLARMFEFKPTGYDALDAKASERGIWGLAAPILTENTTSQEVLDNPRADFCTMYRFIMNDLRTAETLLDDYEFTDKSLPGIHAVRGLMARAWMEIGSRYEDPRFSPLPDGKTQDYAALMQTSDKQKDGYGVLGHYTAADCYQQALTAATAAMEGYGYTTSEQWHDKTTGFNTATNSWIWRMRIGGKEQLPTYYCSFLGQTATEPASGLARYGGSYRCISSNLFGKINNNDWRKTTWIAPTDAGKTTETVLNKYLTLVDAETFASFPKYTNLKFRPGSGNTDDYNVWLIGDLPVMRMEEMEFIRCEAIARTQGWEAGLTELKDFIGNQRFTSGKASSYRASSVTDLPSFLAEMMVQKRIEFWGEGICFFDFKRLNMQVDRTNSNNVEEAFMVKSKQDYCCPWLNFFILQYETNRNSACLANPDVSGYYDVAEEE